MMTRRPRPRALRAAVWFAIGLAMWVGASLLTGPAWYGITSPALVTGQTAIVLQIVAMALAIGAAVRAMTLARTRTSDHEQES